MGHMPLTCEVWPNSRQLVTEWHCTDPSVSSCLENAALLLPLLEHLTLDGHTSGLDVNSVANTVEAPLQPPTLVLSISFPAFGPN